MTTIAVKKAKGKGRKVTYSIKAEGLDLTNTVSVSLKFLDGISSLGDSSLSDEDKAGAMSKLNRDLVGAENWPILLDWLENNTEDLQEEQELLGKLQGDIIQAVLPKAPASDRDKPSTSH